MEDLRQKLHDKIISQYEGKLFRNIDITNGLGEVYISMVYYTVQDGQVCIIENDSSLSPVEDNIVSLISECKMMGKYDSQRKYRRKYTTMTFDEFKKALNL